MDSILNNPYAQSARSAAANLQIASATVARHPGLQSKSPVVALDSKSAFAFRCSLETCMKGYALRISDWRVFQEVRYFAFDCTMFIGFDPRISWILESAFRRGQSADCRRASCEAAGSPVEV